MLKPKHFILCLTLFLATASAFLPATGFAVGKNADLNLPNYHPFTESTIITGYGTRDPAEGYYNYVSLIWHLGIDLKRFFPRLEQHHGLLSGYLEPNINPAFKPETEIEFGIGFGLKYMYPLTRMVSGYIMGSVGPHYITVETADQANGFIFSDIVAAGLTFFLTKTTALDLEYRFRHLSNARLKMPNGGVNSHMVAIGYSMFF